MFTHKVSARTIDLAKPESERWADVIAEDQKIVRKLFREAIKDIDSCIPKLVRNSIVRLLAYGYKKSGGLYVDEMQAWADAIGRTLDEMIVANCSYELSHVFPGLGIFGCTSGVVQAKTGLLHVRNLDWPLRSIGKATRVFTFTRGEDILFHSIGVSGFTGVLSGMRPGAYSVTINWAPVAGCPRFAYGPSFLLREVLEHCASYKEAVDTLSTTPLATSVFYTVCGVEDGEACVIERTADEHRIRKMRNGVLVQANHFLDDEFHENNTDEEVLEYSRERMYTMEDGLASAILLEPNYQSAGIEASLRMYPACNEDTEQRMIMSPKYDKILVWRWT